MLPIFKMKLGIPGQLADVNTCVKFLVNRFRSCRVGDLLTPQNCHFPLTCCVALTTVYALLCDTVMTFDKQVSMILITRDKRTCDNEITDNED